MKRGWFGPKTFGWGAQPTGWQGWLATLLFLVALIGVSLVPEAMRGWAEIGLIAFFLAVVARTYRASDAS